ncbi:MAG: CBS domain-containing protein [Planctomycetota bacterium]|nr:CBS domain-containing protein [Planctomycetota bacterium]
MGRKPIVVAPEATIREAGELLVREKIGALPVLDDGRLIGIVSAEDLLWAFIENFESLRDARDL